MYVKIPTKKPESLIFFCLSTSYNARKRTSQTQFLVVLLINDRLGLIERHFVAAAVCLVTGNPWILSLVDCRYSCRFVFCSSLPSLFLILASVDCVHVSLPCRGSICRCRHCRCLCACAFVFICVLCWIQIDTTIHSKEVWFSIYWNGIYNQFNKKEYLTIGLSFVPNYRRIS